MNKQTIDLDVITGGVPQVLHVAQYDTGARTLEFNIYSSNNDLDLTGATAKISGRKADGLGFEYPATITDGVVVADCTDQMTAVAGIVECAITLTNSEGQIQTARFDLNVKPAPLNDDTVISDSDFPLIQQAIGAEEDAEAWAVGTRNGEPVPVSDPTYENNSKYWAEQAAQTDIGQIEKVKVSWNDASESVKKNLIPYPYKETTKTTAGITYTDLGDGRIQVNGTASSNAWMYLIGSTSNPVEIPTSIKQLLGKSVILSSDENLSAMGVRIDFFDAAKTNIFNTATGSTIETKFTIPSNAVYMSLQIYVWSGNTISNVIIKPMLRLASIKDDTWAPYIPDNTELTTWKANGVLGAKNLIPYPYYQTTQTVNGITTTDNGDGTLTFNGTCTASSVIFRPASNDANIEIPLGKARYILTWVEAGKHNPYFRLDIGLTKSNDTIEVKNGDLGTIEIDNTNGQYKGIFAVSIYSGSGQTVNNLLFKPMLRLAEDTDDTYQPYAMTNRELTALACKKTTAGTYSLQCVVDASGNKTYSWV